MTKIRIVAAVVDTKRLTLYKEDGDTVRIPQGDPRLARIVEETKGVLMAGGVAEVDLEQNNPTTTDYAAFEKKTGGVVRFFKIAKDKLASLMGADPANDLTNNGAPAVEPIEMGNINAALADIMAHAQPATDDNLTTDQTVVAVINDTPIPGAETLQRQVSYSVKMGSTKGMEAFMARIAKVIGERQHSVQDLLRFMERGDLPVADDGSIIIYKILTRRDKHYVDCHTKNVVQRVGSYVCMDKSQVDHNRRVECSQGLHVARRGYLRNFSGDVCVLAKVAPEDVIAVPSHNLNKMRVCGYHILFELPEDAFKAVKQDQPMSDSSVGMELLARAISGDHPAPIEDVFIGGPGGTKLEIRPRTAEGVQAAPVAQPAKPVETIDTSEPGKAPKAPLLDPKALAKSVSPQKVAPVPLKPNSSKKDEARHLFATGNWAKLLAFKKQAKKGWAALGFSDSEIQVILEKTG